MDRSEAERRAAQPPKTRLRRRESDRAVWPLRSVTAKKREAVVSRRSVTMEDEFPGLPG